MEVTTPPKHLDSVFYKNGSQMMINREPTPVLYGGGSGKAVSFKVDSGLASSGQALDAEMVRERNASGLGHKYTSTMPLSPMFAQYNQSNVSSKVFKSRTSQKQSID
jgi:citrate lyase synthetase